MQNNSVWDRVMEEAGRRAPKGRAQQWLVEQLSGLDEAKPYTIQRVQNWKVRGVPRGEYPNIALALRKSIDWVAGIEAPRSDRLENYGPAAEVVAVTAEERPLVLAYLEGLRSISPVTRKNRGEVR